MNPQNKNEQSNVLDELAVKQQELDQKWSQLGQGENSLSIEQKIEMDKDVEIIEDFDKHTPVHCDSFAEPRRVKHWLLKNVRELCDVRHAAIGEPHDRPCREFAEVEPFHGFGFSRKFPAIEEHFLALVECNRIKHL